MRENDPEKDGIGRVYISYSSVGLRMPSSKRIQLGNCYRFARYVFVFKNIFPHTFLYKKKGKRREPKSVISSYF